MAKVHRAARPCGRALVAALALAFIGCATPQHVRQPHPSVAPTTQPTVSLDVGPTELKPMYRELLAIDLPTVLRVADAKNLDIEQARQLVVSSNFGDEFIVVAYFRVLAQSNAYQHL
jgi:hypothetical protein